MTPSTKKTNFYYFQAVFQKKNYNTIFHFQKTMSTFDNVLPKKLLITNRILTNIYYVH